MWFSIGSIEAGMICVALIAAVALASVRQRSWRWASVLSAFISASTLLTPADPLSTIVIGVAFLLFFVGGTRFDRSAVISAV